MHRAFHSVVLALALTAAYSGTAFAAPPGGPVAMTWLGGKPPPEDRPKRHIPMPAGNPTRSRRPARAAVVAMVTARSLASELLCSSDVVYQELVSRGCRQAPPVTRIDPAEVVALLVQIRARISGH